jgi:hypothetical protein
VGRGGDWEERMMHGRGSDSGSEDIWTVNDTKGSETLPLFTPR